MDDKNNNFFFWWGHWNWNWWKKNKTRRWRHWLSVLGWLIGRIGESLNVFQTGVHFASGPRRPAGAASGWALIRLRTGGWLRLGDDDAASAARSTKEARQTVRHFARRAEFRWFRCVSDDDDGASRWLRWWRPEWIHPKTVGPLTESN